MTSPFFLLTSLFLSILSACSNHVDSKPKTQAPNWIVNKSDGLYKVIRDNELQLGLDSLPNGYDSLQIRVWCDYSIVPVRELFVLKRDKSNWFAAFYHISFPADDSLKTLKIERIDTLTPENGWDNFTNKLFKLQIITLPDMNDINVTVPLTDDGVTYSVEVAIKNNYRFYSYSNPSDIKEEYWQAKNMIEIIELIKTEFTIKREPRIGWR